MRGLRGQALGWRDVQGAREETLRKPALCVKGFRIQGTSTSDAQWPRVWGQVLRGRSCMRG